MRVGSHPADCILASGSGHEKAGAPENAGFFVGFGD